MALAQGYRYLADDLLILFRLCRRLFRRHRPRRRESIIVRACTEPDRVRTKEGRMPSKSGEFTKCSGAVAGRERGPGRETPSPAPGNEPTERSEKTVGREIEQLGDGAYFTGVKLKRV